MLVSLSVIALSLSALLVTLQQQIDNSGFLRDKILAKYVASNKLAEFRLISAGRKNIELGTEYGVTKMSGRKWNWKLEISATEQPQIVRVTISVDDEGSQDSLPIHTLNAFLNRIRLPILDG